MNVVASYKLLLVYALVGFGSVGAAFYVSTYLIQPSFSQPAEDLDAKIRSSKINNDEGTIKEIGLQVTGVQEDDYILFLEPYNYDPIGRRDPFVRIGDEASLDAAHGAQPRPLLPLERYDLNEIKLIGIVWNVKNPRAMFLDPTKKVHVLGKDERIGRNQGYIAVIREGEIIVVETTEKNGELIYSTKVMRLATNKDKEGRG